MIYKIIHFYAQIERDNWSKDVQPTCSITEFKLQQIVSQLSCNVILKFISKIINNCDSDARKYKTLGRNETRCLSLLPPLERLF
jgi:hypothetical protein